MKRILLLSALLVWSTTPSRSQPYSIDWFKIAGGGGTSTNAQFSLSGTVGQPDASSAMVGGKFALTGGFWALYAVQTAGAPTLYIRHSGMTVTVFWQAVSGWGLQQNPSLNAPNGWTTINGWTTANGTNYLVLSSSPGDMFYQLKLQ
jgi:hypothetical protein